MPDAKSKFLSKIIEDKDEAKAFTSERQHTAQAFCLHVQRRDGRRAEGFAWSHYTGHRWEDDGEKETLTIVFGPRAVEIEGHNLGALVTEIREGQLNGIPEMLSSRVQLLMASNPDNEPIIRSIKTYPDFEEVLKEIKGDGERGNGFAGKIGR